MQSIPIVCEPEGEFVEGVLCEKLSGIGMHVCVGGLAIDM